jgi:hypothetical protein
MYTVRIPGLKSAMTAAVFQGEGAEEVCPDGHLLSQTHHCNSNGRRQYPDIRMFGGDIQGDPPLATSDKWYHRHPNLMQMYGVASTGKLYATVFHNGSGSSAFASLR